MSSLRQLLETPVEDVTTIVNYKDFTFTLSGRPDATILAMYGDEAKLKNSALHLSKLAKKPISTTFAAHVEMLPLLLVAPAGEKKYDKSEVLKLALNHGPLFLLLVQAATKILGLVPPTDEGEDPIAEVAVKNSSAAA